jgi:hypothetical protein
MNNIGLSFDDGMWNVGALSLGWDNNMCDKNVRLLSKPESRLFLFQREGLRYKLKSRVTPWCTA